MAIYQITPEGVGAGGARLWVGQEVLVAGYVGHICFLGRTRFAPGNWVGICLELSAGVNDGEVLGERYFSCDAKRGIFVRMELVKPRPAWTPVGYTIDPDSGSVLNISGARRRAISAETSDAITSELARCGKTSSERRFLTEIIRSSRDSRLWTIFGQLAQESFEQVLECFFHRSVKKGVDLMNLADLSPEQHLFVVKDGRFALSRLVAKETQVYEATTGFIFGELALLHSGRASFSVIAMEDSEVWCLERTSLRHILVVSAESRFQAHVALVRKCDLFQGLDADQIAKLVDIASEEDFSPDEVIVEQGERNDTLFILSRGSAVACIKRDGVEVEKNDYRVGDHFCGLALLQDEPSEASVYATGFATCLYLARSAVERVLGPVHISLNAEKYHGYGPSLEAQAVISEDWRKEALLVASDGEQLDIWESESAKALIKSTRRRERIVARDASSEVSMESVGGLKEKCARDFQNLALVQPNFAAFEVHGRTIQLFGGLRLGEIFRSDKSRVCISELMPQVEGLEECYSWRSPLKLQGIVDMAVVCQKGQKSEMDPTPNQDNYFALQVGEYGIYGVCDGHGPFGHLMSFRLVQSLPHLITTSVYFGQNWEVCLKEAFILAQKELLEFCAKHDVNNEASGSTGSVLVCDGQVIHMAHIGDSTMMLASWNKRDAMVIHATEDHKPQIPQEKARLEAAGSEVRRIDEESYRIYLPGTGFPGLTMSRAFGDTACRGVLQEPDYWSYQIQPKDELYAILASDGVWEFMDSATVMALTGKKLRLKGPMATVQYAIDCSRKRWTTYCGDYCDDITCLVIQWNCKPKNPDPSTNHTLHVFRQE